MHGMLATPPDFGFDLLRRPCFGLDQPSINQPGFTIENQPGFYHRKSTSFHQNKPGISAKNHKKNETRRKTTLGGAWDEKAAQLATKQGKTCTGEPTSLPDRNQIGTILRILVCRVAKANRSPPLRKNVRKNGVSVKLLPPSLPLSLREESRTTDHMPPDSDFCDSRFRSI